MCRQKCRRGMGSHNVAAHCCIFFYARIIHDECAAACAQVPAACRRLPDRCGGCMCALLQVKPSMDFEATAAAARAAAISAAFAA
jgi:hypothetical protein